MLVYIQGSDSFLAKNAIDQLKTKYRSKNDGAELIEIDGDSPLPNLADLAAVPLFASSRLVIIKRVGLLDAASQDALARVLGHLPATTVAVVWDQKPLPKSALLTTLAAAKTISVAPLSETGLRRWVAARAKELKLELDAAAVDNLLSASGGDLWFLATELGYLATVGRDQEDNRHQKAVKSDDYFVYFRLVRQRNWSKVSRQLTVDFQNGIPFELLLGTLAAAVRKEVSDRAEKLQLVELMSDLDFGAKTGLIEPGEAIALLAHHLPKPAAERLHWEAMWEGMN